MSGPFNPGIGFMDGILYVPLGSSQLMFRMNNREAARIGEAMIAYAREQDN